MWYMPCEGHRLCRFCVAGRALPARQGCCGQKLLKYVNVFNFHFILDCCMFRNLFWSQMFCHPNIQLPNPTWSCDSVEGAVTEGALILLMCMSLTQFVYCIGCIWSQILTEVSNFKIFIDAWWLFSLRITVINCALFQANPCIWAPYMICQGLEFYFVFHK